MRSISLDSEVPLETLPYRLQGEKHPGRRILQTNPRGLIDSYLEGETGFHVHLRTRNKVANSKTEDFVFVFENMLLGRELGILNGHAFGNSDGDRAIRDCCSDKMKSPVPVNSRPVIQHFENSSKVEVSPIRECADRSLVRLYSFDQVSNVLRNDLLHAPQGLLEFCGVGTEDKFPLLLIGGRVLFEMQNGGVIHAGIQSRTELIKHLAEMERERQEPIALDGSDEKLPRPVVLHISAGSINLVLVQSVPYLYERVTVRLCPRDAIPTRLEW